ncbi:type II toxin-antitoxin system HicB family antitoxin [Methylosoma difficile]
MNTMTYQGYTARIEFDERDGIFWGKVLGIKDSITFEGETVAQLRQDFHNAIDFYLADCAAICKDPKKPASGKLMLRVPPELHAAALVKAQAVGKSLNQWAIDALSREVGV